MNQEWALLWAARRNEIQVVTVAGMLEANRIAYRDGRPCDYVPLIIGSRELVEATAENLHPTLHRRDMERATTREAATAGAPT